MKKPGRGNIKKVRRKKRWRDEESGKER